VALKETLVTTDELRRAFEREARLLANLSHPSLPRVVDHFSEDAGQYLVMDYIPGDDLKSAA
jgi:eukaryotic-like serine/threonine-protein kinase